MALGRGEEELSVMEAVDYLSNMTEIDVKDAIDFEEDELSTEINWRDPKQALQNEAIVKETFRVIHRYLQNMVRNDQNCLKDADMMKGVQAIILLADEAVEKLDEFAALHPKTLTSFTKLKEYTDLKKYYRQQMLKQMPMPPEETESWEEEAKSFTSVQAEKSALRDLEAVRKDQSYELFFIKNENDKPYFSKNLIRHIRLIGNFDDLVSNSGVVVINFWDPDCPSCTQMSPIFESVAREMKDQALFAAVQVNEASDVIERLFIHKVPCLLVFKDGSLVARYANMMGHRELTTFLGQFLSSK